jgi:putative chitinase
MLTRDELLAIMPHADGVATKVLAGLDAAMERFEINTPVRQAAFLAQLAHESGELRHWTENLNYGWQGLLKTFPKYFKSEADARRCERKPELIANRVYAGRMGNGDEASGDGWRYRGRGPIQLTGKDNYRACGTALGIELVNQPELLETPEVGCLAACWFWSSKGLNKVADAGDFVHITQVINGGLNGLKERTAFWERAKAAFGVSAPAVVAPRALRSTADVTTLERAVKRAGGARKKPTKRRITTATKSRRDARTARSSATRNRTTQERKARIVSTQRMKAKVRRVRAKASATTEGRTIKASISTGAKKKTKAIARIPVAAATKRPRGGDQ